MTNEQLMQPRVLLTGPYPEMERHNLKVGDIIPVSDTGMIADKTQDGKAVFPIDHAIFPNLFRRLEWHEFRDEKDMPGYVKFQEKVYKVIRYRKPNIIRIIDDFWKTEIWQEIGEPYWLPATAEEYEQFTHPAPLGDKQ